MEDSPGGREEKEKLTHIQIRCKILDFYSFLSFLLSFQINVSEDSSLVLQGPWAAIHYFQLKILPVRLSPEEISCKNFTL